MVQVVGIFANLTIYRKYWKSHETNHHLILKATRKVSLWTHEIERGDEQRVNCFNHGFKCQIVWINHDLRFQIVWQIQRKRTWQKICHNKVIAELYLLYKWILYDQRGPSLICFLYSLPELVTNIRESPLFYMFPVQVAESIMIHGEWDIHVRWEIEIN